MKQPNFLRKACRKATMLSMFFTLLMSMSHGQGEELADRQAASFRLDLLQNTNFAPNAQTPPYFWSGVYLRNAFAPATELAIFRLDSSLCGKGVPGSQQFGSEIKAYYSYDADGQVSEIIFKQERPGPVYENFSRKVFTYANGNRTNYLYQRWNMATNAWQDDYEEISSFTPEGRQQGFIIREQDMSGQWQNLIRENRIFDLEGNTIEVLSAKWSNGAWIDTARKEIDYNARGFFKAIYEESWNGSSWDTLSKESALYGDRGMTWEGYLYQRKTTNGFENVLREQYDYDDRGYWTQMTQQLWDEQAGSWENETRESYQYTRRGIWTGWNRQDWVDTTWVDSYRQRFETDGSGRLDIRQSWDAASASWVREARTLARYDGDFNLMEEVGVQIWDGSGWVNDADSKSCQHFWSEETATSVKPKLPQLSCTLSNPYRAYSPIACEALSPTKSYQVKLHDMQGRTIIDQSIPGGSAFSIDRKLPQGIYTLNIYENQQIRFAKNFLSENKPPPLIN